jgi:hypothetical protein
MAESDYNPILRSADYSEIKSDNPTILTQLGDYITTFCTHGLKKPLATEKDGNVVYLCCLKCAVEFLFKDRAKNKITQR